MYDIRYNTLRTILIVLFLLLLVLYVRLKHEIIRRKINRLLLNKEFVQADEFISRLSKKYPDDQIPHLYRLIFLLAYGDLEGFFKFIKEIEEKNLKIDRFRRNIYYYRIEALFLNGQIEEAMKLLIGNYDLIVMKNRKEAKIMDITIPETIKLFYDGDYIKCKYEIERLLGLRLYGHCKVICYKLLAMICEIENDSVSADKYVKNARECAKGTLYEKYVDEAFEIMEV
ncbi:MAG: tetratricopeptide repeat protein [Saccharofermentanales bacterium]